MIYHPQFSITSRLLSLAEEISAVRQRILSAAVDVSWIPAAQLDSRSRNTHSSTAIEGNPLTLEQVRAVQEGRELAGIQDRSQREVVNYLAGLRHIEQHPAKAKITHADIYKLHHIVAADVMDQGQAGQYRIFDVRVGAHIAPPHATVMELMTDLLNWWHTEAPLLSPILSSAILHFRFEDIHPFADGNGRTGRALALWELYRRRFDTHHIFSVDEFYWEDRPRYYEALNRVHKENNDLTQWLEYTSEGLLQTLERVWRRIQTITAQSSTPRFILKPKQEQLLQFLRDRGSMAPREIWEALGISKQGAMNIINPLLEAHLIVKEGTKKSGRYRLVQTFQKKEGP